MLRNHGLPILMLIVAGAARASAQERAPAYDPLRLPESVTVKVLDFTVEDDSRQREIPIRVFLPSSAGPASVVLFSHGLGGSREGNAFMGEHWGKRGYVVVVLQHPGSDTSVWKDAPLLERMSAMRQAASLQNFLLRVEDVPRVLEQLTAWNKLADHPLHGRLDLDRVGMSGHSFGANTTQAVSGQSIPLGGQRYTDPRIKAAIAFSPGPPQGRTTPEQAFGSVQIPWMLMTGTKDTAPIGGQTVESRLTVFPALPPGDKYELVLHEANHYAFTDVLLPGEPRQRNPNHHPAILGLSTAFWDTYLGGDEAAKTWLANTGPRTLLEPDDRWQRK